MTRQAAILLSYVNIVNTAGLVVNISICRVPELQNNLTNISKHLTNITIVCGHTLKTETLQSADFQHVTGCLL